MIAHGHQQDTDSLLVAGSSDVAIISVPAVLDCDNVSSRWKRILQLLGNTTTQCLLGREHWRNAKKMRLLWWTRPEAIEARETRETREAGTFAYSYQLRLTPSTAHSAISPP